MDKCTASSDAVLRAIEAVSGAVHRARVGDRARLVRAAGALETVAAITRHHGTVSVKAARTAIVSGMLQPVDPSEIHWNVFRLLEVQESETFWTRWLAATLAPENGPALSGVMWRSFCDAVVSQRIPPTPSDASHHIAALDDWRLAARTPLAIGRVSRERADAAFGRPDIVIDAAELFVVLENKLNAGWHDGYGEPQAVRYRDFGLKYRSATQRLGLVLLTKRDNLRLDYRCQGYVRVLYRELARALRRTLRTALPTDAPAAAVFALWPALLTVAAIEQDLLRLDIARWRRTAGSWQNLRLLEEIRAHLRDEDAQ